MRNLFIIGNGFDLAHGLYTSYNHFYNSIPSLIETEDNLDTNKFYLILKSINAEKKWCDIEYLYFQILLNYNNPKFFSHYKFLFESNLESSIYKDPKELNKEFNVIKKYLERHLSQQQESFNQINELKELFSLFNERTTLVLNFNYTNTISKYIEECNQIKLINIHGELFNEKNPIIFGYAASDDESKKLIDYNDNELMRNIKKVNYNLTNNESELKNQLDNSPEDFDIFILGHSCGLSDKLILNQIFNHERVNSIQVFYYNDNEGYLQTAINIDRIIDDYSKENKKDVAFVNLKTLNDSIKMIQHNSKEDERKIFIEKINQLKSNQTPLFVRTPSRIL